MKCHIIISAICFIILLAQVAPICDAMDGTAIIANNPRAVGFSFKLGSNEHNFALGHVAVAFQKYDGTFIFSSIESGSSFWGIPLPAGRVNKDKIGLHFNTFDDLKEYMCTNEYTTYKIISVDNFNPAMALDVTGSIKDPGDLGQPSTFYNVLGSLTKPITDSVRQLMGIVLDPLVGFFDEDSPKSYARVGDVPNDENCLTSSIKILNAYGADMPYISALLSTPNAYYIALPYETHYIDSLDYNIAILQSPEIADNSPPIVQFFQVTPITLITGEYLTIDYTVSDNGGSGLKQVELWRMDEQSDWMEIDRNSFAGENGPIDGAFTDSPSDPGTYWYGVHVVDNTGNWNDQRNSNTNYKPINFDPIEVEVKSSERSFEKIGEETLALRGHSNIITSVVFSPDSRAIATASWDGTARIWDVATGEEVRRFYHAGYQHVIKVAFSPDGRKLATACAITPIGDNCTARIWDAVTGAELQKLAPGHELVLFSPDGTKLVTECGTTISIWDVATGTELQNVNHDWLVLSEDFSPDSSKIITSCSHTARILDAETGVELQELNHNSAVLSATFSPDGGTVATASWDRTARIWDVATGEELIRLNVDNPLGSIVFSPNGRKVAVTKGWEVIIWDIG